MKRLDSAAGSGTAWEIRHAAEPQIDVARATMRGGMGKSGKRKPWGIWECASCAGLRGKVAAWHQVSWCGGFAPDGVDVSATLQP